MRIGLLGTVRTLDRQVRPELLAALPTGTQLSAWPSRVGVFPSTPVERDMQAIGHLEAGLQAAAAGMDAVVIDSVGDYGLDALRAALAIPAFGAGEAGMAAAARHGQFAIVTVWPVSMNFVPNGLLQAYGYRDRCRGIHNVGDEAVITQVSGHGGYLDRIHRAEQSVLDRVVAAVDAAAAAGADAVMLGCTCMSPMAARVANAVRIPVINPLSEGARLAAAAVVAAAASSPGARPSEPVRTARADLITRMVDAIAGEEDESCPVCAVDSGSF